MESKMTFKNTFVNPRTGEETLNVMETNKITVTDILEDFTYFLRGCGFIIDSLEHVGNDEYVTKDIDEEV